MDTVASRTRTARASRLTRLAVIVALAASTSGAFAQGGGFLLYENGSPDMGSSYAGASARANDAGTVFNNPAGMTRLEGNHLLVGALLVIPTLEFDIDFGGSTLPAGPPNDGDDAGLFAPALGSFGVIQINDKWRAGFAINALGASGVDYDPQWVGRQFITKNEFIALNIQPTVAYEVNEWLSLGVGLNVVYTSFKQEFKATAALDAPTIQIDDADDWGVGATFGVLLSPREGTRIGFTYRMEIDLTLSGDVRSPIPGGVNFDTDFPIPQGINLGVYHELNDQWALLGDVGWTDWSTFDNLATTAGPVGTAIPRDWDDTWRVGAGFRYLFGDDKWAVRAGISYDSSPVDDDKRTPDIPVGAQYRFSTGLQHDFGHGKIFGVSYTYVYADMDSDQVPLGVTGVVLDGEYESRIHFVGMNMALTF